MEWRERGRRREREEKQAGEVYTEKTGKKRCLPLSFMDAGDTVQAVSLAAEGTATPRGSLKRIVILPLCKSLCWRYPPLSHPILVAMPKTNSQGQVTRWSLIERMGSASKRNHSVDGL